MQDNFVAHSNIKRFEAMIAAERDPKRRAILAGLLAEEKLKVGDRPGR